MADEGMNPKWDGTSSSDVAHPTPRSSDQGKTNKPVRAQSPSSLNADEERFLNRSTATYDDSRLWPRKSDSGGKETGQATK